MGCKPPAAGSLTLILAQFLGGENVALAEVTCPPDESVVEGGDKPTGLEGPRMEMAYFRNG